MSDRLKDVLILTFIFVCGIITGKLSIDDMKDKIILGNTIQYSGKFFKCKDVTHAKDTNRTPETF